MSHHIQIHRETNSMIRISSFSAFTYESDDDDDDDKSEEGEKKGVSCCLLLGFESHSNSDDDGEPQAIYPDDNHLNRLGTTEGTYLMITRSKALTRSDSSSSSASLQSNYRRPRRICKRRYPSSPPRIVNVVAGMMAIFLLVLCCQAFLWFLWQSVNVASATFDPCVSHCGR